MEAGSAARAGCGGPHRGTTWLARALVVAAVLAWAPVRARTVEAPAPAQTASRTALRASYVQAVQTRAPGRYRAVRRAAGGAAAYRAHNPEQRLVADFSAGGVRIAPARGGAAFSAGLELRRYGCQGELRRVAAAPPAAAGNRVEYRRRASGGAAIVEWYVNGPLGLWQGFTLPAAPRCGRAAGSVVIEMDVRGGLTPRLAADGREVELRRRAGVALRYADLYAYDAAGRELPARLAVAGRRIVIRVDARGAVYPVTVDPLIAVERAKLVASDGAGGDYFGSAVAVSGGTAVVGAYRDGGSAGAAYVFVRGGTAWNEQAKLVASDGAGGDQFGFAVAVDGDTAVVGAYGKNSLAGAAYVFVRSGTTWSEQAKLVASDGAANDVFGLVVGVSGDTAVVGSYNDDDLGSNSGSAYVFVRSGTTWSEQAKLVASDGAAGDELGDAVAIAGDTVIVGAQTDDDLGTNSGSAYVFVRSGTTWSEQAKLVASDGAASDYFGWWVAVAGDTAVVGSYHDDDLGADSGSAYVFVRSGTTWSEQAKLVASDGAAGDGFGTTVGVSGDLAVVSTPTQGGAGAAYLFLRSGTSWTELAKLVAADTTAGDRFGAAAAVSQSTVLVGAELDDDLGTSSGAAYVFAVGQSNGETCSAAADCASGFCVDGVCCESACPGACSACNLAGSAGTCTAAPAGSDPRNQCPGSGPCKAACGAGGLCVYPGPATSCAQASCDGTLLHAYTCDGNGACVDRGAVDCTPYLCVSGACPTSCSDDTVCASGHQCSAGSCGTDRPNGAACGTAADCASGFCVDDVCCAAACDGPCERCDRPPAPGGTIDGTCRVPEGEDPDGDCPGAGVCAGACAAGGSCAYPGAETPCDTCTACDGAGACARLPLTADDPACGTISCAGLSTECRSYSDLTTARCTARGACAEPDDPAACTAYVDEPNGTSCTGGTCWAGACADGGVPDVAGGDGGSTDAAAGDLINVTGRVCGCRASAGQGGGALLALAALLGLAVRRRH